MTTAWSSYVEQKAIKTLSAAEITIIYTLEPLFASLFSLLLLGEEFGVNTVVGAMFIVGACLWKPLILPSILQYNSTRQESKDEEDTVQVSRCTRCTSIVPSCLSAIVSIVAIKMSSFMSICANSPGCPCKTLAQKKSDA